MVCRLSDKQKGSVIDRIAKILANPIESAAVTPQWVIRNVYDGFYEAFAKASLVDKAEPYAIEAARYAAENLYQILSSDKAADFRKTFQAFAQNEAEFTQEAIQQYTNTDQIRNLMNLKDVELKFTPSLVKEEQVAPILEKIAKSFPQIKDFTTFQTPQGIRWRFASIKEGEKVLKLPEVTDFVYDKKTKGTDVLETRALKIGTLSDYVIRQFLKQPMDYVEFRKKMAADPSVIKSFASFTTGDSLTEIDATDPLLATYMDNFIKDLTYGIDYIMKQYEGYYLTDLTSLLNDTSLPEELKNRFFIYSREIGLRGELDILAISPDGTFRVVDIKTAGSEITRKTESKYQTQTSIYDMIIQKATGLQSENKVDIIYLSTSISNPSNTLVKNQPGRWKAGITGYNKVSLPTKDSDQLLKDVQKYKEALDTMYVNEVKVTPTPPVSTKPLASIALPRTRMKMILKDGENRSTTQDLLKGKQWLEKTFPEMDPDSIKIVNGLINSNVGGEFFTDAITLYERSNQGVAYHEGWHRFSQLFLTKAEKVDLYSKARARNKNFTTRDGRELNTTTAPLIDIEEYLAEEFKDHALKQDKRSSLGKLFDKILNVLKAIANYFKQNDSYAFQKLYTQVYNGSFNTTNFNVNNSMFTHLNSIFIDSVNGRGEILDDFTYNEFKQFMDYYMSNYMQGFDITIVELMSNEGIQEITRVITQGIESVVSNSEARITDAREQRAVTSDISEQRKIDATIKDLEYFKESAEKILLEEDGKRINLPDFLRAYFKTSDLETLRTFNKKNKKRIQESIEDALEEQLEQEDSDPLEDDEPSSKKPMENETSEWNRSGNEEEVYALARAELKDFFVGVPRRKTREQFGQDPFEYSKAGVPLVLPKQEAFFKLLELTEGSLDWNDVLGVLNNPDSVFKFPEIVSIRERLLGGAIVDGQANEGIFTKWIRLSAEINEGNFTNIDEHANLTSFMSHFLSVFTMFKMPFENPTIKTNYEKKLDSEEVSSVRPIATRESMEMIINNIINDFTKGFQKNMRREFGKAYRASKDQRQEEQVDDFLKGYEEGIKGTVPQIYTDVFDLMHGIFVTGDDAFLSDTFRTKLPGQKFLYDPIVGSFYFNPLYANNLAHTREPSEKQMKEFFGYMGITINDRAYQSERDFQQLQSAYNTLQSISYNLGRKSNEAVISLLGNNGLKSRLIQWKDASDKLKALGTQGESTLRIALEAQLANEQFSLRGYISAIFPHNPVQQMLFDSQDKELMKTDHGKIFAMNRFTFEKLAKVEKAYHKNFSSGSMLVKDDLQFSYFLRNQMNIITSRINNNIDNFDDFDKYPELNHLNPKLNPQILNSFIFSRLFNRNGEKIPGAKLDLTNIAQVTIIHPTGNIETKKIGELKEDEKLLWDIVMIEGEGSAEMRRMEASNTANRLGVSELLANGETFKIKAIRGLTTFSSPAFQARMRSYVIHAAFKYKYYRDPANREAASATNWQKKNLDNLSIFDEMAPKSIPGMKKMIDAYTGDMNLVMNYIEIENPELMQTFQEEVAAYFEGITIKNEDSFRKYVDATLSEKSMDILYKLSEIRADRNPIQLNHMGKLTDNILRDFIANDFIMAMEDALLFFGDYTNYEDPSKRRKILANNGSIQAVDPYTRAALDAQAKISLSAIYQQAKGITSTKDRRLVSKVIMEDVRKDSKILSTNDKGELDFINDIIELRKQRFGVTEAYAKVAKDKENTISAFTNMKLADAGAYISLDTYRAMLQRERRWTPEMEEEYKRQQLILKDKLNLPINEAERIIINTPTRGYFNVAKFALTGPVYSEKPGLHLPSFDKMGLRVLLPEYDFSTTMRPVFEYMLENDIDYVAFDSASKGFMPTIHKSFDKETMMSVFADQQKNVTQHAGVYFKNQLNTSEAKTSSTFSSQLRGIFFEIILIREKYGKTSKELESTYKALIKSLSDYITVNSSKSLSEMGLDPKGIIKDKTAFITYLKNRLIDNDTVARDLIERLSINNDDSLATALEALPFQREIGNLLSGVIDDNFRKIKLNGSKLIQSPEIGTQEYKRVRKGDLADEGTVELKWHGLKRDSKGNFTETTEVEVKVNFKKQWEPLFNLQHPDGKLIGISPNTPKAQKIRRLNEALRNEEFVERNKASFTFIGVRIPLQDINFSSHMIIKEFLPEAVGDMLLAPPEFYQQTGSDNDIDSVTTTFKYLDNRGKVVRKSEKSYEDIINRISDLSTQIAQEQGKVSQEKTLPEVQEQMNELKQAFIDEKVYFSKGKTLADLDRELEVIKEDGMFLIQGQKSSKSTFLDLIKKGQANQEVEAVMDYIDQLNRGNKGITSDLKKELASLLTERRQYIQGLTNDIVSNIEKFMRLPENYDFLTETDSIEKIKGIAVKNLANKTGRDASSFELGKPLTSLQNMSYRVNQINHVNNFEIRSILGSIVKFRRILTTLAKLDLKIQKDYTAGSMAALQEKFLADNMLQGLLGEIPKNLPGAKSKTYQRHIYTPLLHNKDTSDGIKISIFDENGERITKNLSMLTSSLLDLFKNADIFPSLGISWLNVKTSIFLITQGVPLERVVLFMNNPIVEEVEKMMKKKGTDIQDRHALVMVSQALFKEDEAIHKGSDPADIEYIMKNKDVYAPTQIPEINGPEVTNQMMRRHGKASDQYLRNNIDDSFQLSDEDLTNFTRDWNEHLRTETVSHKRQLAHYLKNSPYKDMAKNILAYYSTLLEDGDFFYKFYIKSLNRDAVKHNSPSSIATAENVKKLRAASNMIDAREFEEKVAKDSTQAPFFNDEIVKNVIGNIVPRLLNHSDSYFRDKYTKMLEIISSSVIGTTEYKNKVDYKVHADFLDFVYKKFFLIKENQNGKMVANTPYEWYEWDITPLLRPLQGQDDFNTFLDTFNQGKEHSLSINVRTETTYNQTLFANQMETMKLKYPELDSLNLFNQYIVDRIIGIDPGTTDFQAKDVLNYLDQNFVHLNLAANPKERADIEAVIRNEWKNLSDFNLSLFPELENEVSKNPERLDFYTKPENIEEIRIYAKKLAEYMLTQSSHLASSRGSFAHLIPNKYLKEGIETSLDNFDRFLTGKWDNNEQLNKKQKEEVVNKIMTEFTKMFRDMNGDLKWQQEPKITTNRRSSEVDFADDMEEDEKEPPVRNTYKPYKKEFTGKLYSKINIDMITRFQQAMMSSVGAVYGRNKFAVNPFELNNDPLNCKI